MKDVGNLNKIYYYKINLNVSKIFIALICVMRNMQPYEI